ncbi:hypothetical protein N431DRAFT_431899, partial [Stipitochalara longipes BDJ]
MAKQCAYLLPANWRRVWAAAVAAVSQVQSFAASRNHPNQTTVKYGLFSVALSADPGPGPVGHRQPEEPTLPRRLDNPP